VFRFLPRGPRAPSSPDGWAAFGRALLALVLPRVCVVCEAALPDDAGARLACPACHNGLAAFAPPWCERCGQPGDWTRRSCPLCLHLDASPAARLVWGRSVTWADAPTASALLYALKYEGWPAVADELASWMAPLGPPPAIGAARPVLVPVPLHPARQRERGYNQSERLATALGRRWGLPVRPDLLRRVRAAESQTRLTAAERLANVKDSFATVAAPRLAGRQVILVDDVVTTGATLAACARPLLAGGAQAVSFVTFGRARAPADRPPRR
jgi:ComF family protein